MRNEALSAALTHNKPILVLTGDRYIAMRALKAIKRKVVPDQGMRDANICTYEGKEAGKDAAGKMIKMCRTAPVFAPRRLVIVIDPPDLSVFTDYCATPDPRTCLTLILDKLDARTKVAQTLKRTGVIVQFDAPKEYQMAIWLQGEAQGLRIPITSDACALIVQTVGSDMPQLLDALERCYLSAPCNTQVQVEHIEHALCTSRKLSVFDLTDACANRDLGRAMHVLQNLLINREEPFKLMLLLTSHIRKLLQCIDLCSRGHQTGDTIASLLKMHPFAAGKLLQQARGLTADRTFEMHEFLYQCAVKLSPGNKAAGLCTAGDRAYLEQAVMGMCRRG